MFFKSVFPIIKPCLLTFKTNQYVCKDRNDLYKTLGGISHNLLSAPQNTNMNFY